jgi:CheY-like chemotaxis protein
MDMRCPRCGGPTEIAGHEDAREFHACLICGRVWPAALVPLAAHVSLGLPAARVLVADDSEAMVQLLGMWLEEENCEVLRALSGREALDLASGRQPEIAFLDIYMPPPDGYGVCEVLKSRAPTEVILMTGVSAPDVRRANDLDALMLLRKPFTRDDAIAAYAAAVRQSIRRMAAGA